jgi:predicted Zn finger-like uncharacterized protein
MKISCQSCQSKYNVADEKVQGKIVRIRCRKCGSTIVVDGTKPAAANGSTASTTGSAPVHSPSYSVSSVSSPTSKADAQPWHVNVAEDDQRTMALAEVVAAYGSGVITQETFIWTEGMEDWKPLGEVESVVLALHEAAAAPVPNSPAKSANGFASDLGGSFGAASDHVPAMGGASEPIGGTDPTRVYPSGRPEPASPQAASAPAGGLDTGPAPVRAEPKRAAIKREPRTRDLFASRANPDELHSGGSPVESGGALLQMSGSSGPVDDGSKRLGERNENSVLFSLAMLTKTADIPASSDGSTASTEDDSGLIDLKALAAKTESLRPGAMTADAAFSAPLGSMQPLGAPLGAIVAPLGDVSRKSRLPAVIGVSALLVFLLAAGVAIGVKWAGARPPVQIATAPVVAEPTATASAPADTAPAASVAASASQAVATAPPTATAARHVGGGGTATVHPQSVGSKAATAPNSGAAAEAPPPPPKKAGGDCGCNGDLMCLMKCSTH